MSILTEKEASLWPATDGDAIITSLAKPDKPVTQRQEDNYSPFFEDAYSDLSIIEAKDPKNMEAAERHLVAGVSDTSATSRAVSGGGLPRKTLR
jgi:hypothetical protein